MRILAIILICLSLAKTEAADTPASVLMARAIQLLQDNEKKEALKLLEAAFERTNDPQELRVIGGLILEASPLDYPKRDAYLRYLVKFAADHQDYPKWMRELGDRALNQGKLDEAEDWYLRSLVFFKEDEQPKVKYQLAWVYWNKKQREKALSSFLEIYSQSESFRENLRADLIRLWWEMEIITPATLENFKSLPEHEKRLLIIELTTQAKGKNKETLRKSLDFLGQNTEIKKLIMEQIASGWKISEHPCVVFESFLKISDSFPSQLLLECLKSKDAKESDKLLSFLENYQGERPEALVWAQVELLIKANRSTDAAKLLLQNSSRNSSAEFFQFGEKLLLSLTEEDILALLAELGPESFENFLRLKPSSALLSSLQSLQAERFLHYQETEQADSLDKAFWIRKAAFQAQKEDTDLRSLRDSLEKIFSYELSPTETAVRDNLRSLQSRAETQLPPQFGESFMSEYTRWISDLDQSIKIIRGAGSDWIRIAEPFLKMEIQRNLNALQLQIDALQLPEDAQELAEGFDEKKSQLKGALDQKYAGILKGDTRP